MKAERRHELKENDLVHALTLGREYLDRNSKQIGIAVLIVGAVALVVMLGVRSRAAAIENVWRRKNELRFEKVDEGRQSLEALATMTQEVSDDTFVFASLVEQGTQALRLAQETWPAPDRALTQRAKETFEQLLRRFPDNPLAFGLGHTGLASVEENLFVIDGKLEHRRAVEAHLSAIIDNPRLDGLPFKRIAMDRRDNLDDTFTRIVYGAPKEEPKPTAAAPQIDPSAALPSGQPPAETAPPSTPVPQPTDGQTAPGSIPPPGS